MDANQPIGVFDSGIGGISVLQKIREQLTGEHLIYVADSAYAPYGNKPREFIESRALAITDFLLSKDIKTLVIACNTATYAVAEHLRERYPQLIIIAMEPGIKPAVLATKTGVIGALATESTLSSEKFKKLIELHAGDKTVLIQPCYGLVEQIEQGNFNSPQIKALLVKYLQPLLEKNADTIVLGCTHYPFIGEAIVDIAGPNITLIETSEAVAKHLYRRLSEAQLLASSSIGKTDFWASSQSTLSQAVVSALWREPVIIHLLPEHFQYIPPA